MKEKLFNHYLNLVLLVALVSNFIKLFVPATDYMFGIALAIICFVLNVYVFYFRHEESKFMQVMVIVFFVLALVLLVLELVSLDYPIPAEPQPYVYRGPHTDKFTPPDSVLIFVYRINIIARIVGIINSFAFAMYFGFKFVKSKKHQKKYDF